MARPQKPIDEKLLEKLAKLHLSDKVIADILGIHEDTLHRRYSEKIEQCKSQSKAKLAEVIFDEAINKRNTRMIELAAKRYLGFDNDTQVIVQNNTFEKLTDEQLEAKLKEKKEKLGL